MSYTSQSTSYSVRRSSDVRVVSDAGTREQRVRHAQSIVAETAIQNALRTFAQQSARFRDTKAGSKHRTRFDTRTQTFEPAQRREAGMSRKLEAYARRTRVDDADVLFNDTAHLTERVVETREIDLAMHRTECERRRRASVNAAQRVSKSS